jgi:hypothetical protein
LLGTAGVVATAAPAAAGIPIAAHANVGITYTSTTFTVCAAGSVDDGTGTAGTWALEIDGARSNGTDIHQTYLTTGETLPLICFPIPKNGTANGAFVATLSFATLGTSSPNIVPDFSAIAGGEGDWNPNGSNTFGT